MMMKMLFKLGLTVLLLLATTSRANESFYRIEADIDPTKRFMRIGIDHAFRSDAARNKVRFLIHDDLDIEKVEGPDVAAVEFQNKYNPFGLPESCITAVDVTFDQPLEAGEVAHLRWEYSGWIEPEHVQLGPDATYRDWVELDLGSLWHPVEESLTNVFTYQAHVSVPEGFIAIGAGNRRKADNTYVFETKVPHASASIALSQRLHSFEVDGSPSFALHYTDPVKGVEALAASVGRAMKLFTHLFGELPAADHFNIVLPPSTRARPEGYSRDRYLVISHDMEPGEGRFRFLAHEAAHLWWHGAPSQGPTNFFNESFAEYAAWIAVKERHGEEAFQRQLQNARKTASPGSSIHDWNPRDNHRLMYRHGPLVLHELRTRIDDDSVFFALLRTVNSGWTRRFAVAGTGAVTAACSVVTRGGI